MLLAFFQHGVGPLDDAKGRHVAFGVPRKHQNVFLSGSLSAFHEVGFVVDRIDIHAVPRHLNLRVWSLNDTNWRLFSVGPAAIIQNGLAKSAGHHNLIVRFVVVHIVRIAHELRSLSCNSLVAGAIPPFANLANAAICGKVTQLNVRNWFLLVS